jgi:hypothetical protein
LTTVRLTKYQQRYLTGIWRDMPPEVRAQLTQQSVRNVDVDGKDIAGVLDAIEAQRAHTGCKARRRILDALAEAMTSPVKTGR